MIDKLRTHWLSLSTRNKIIIFFSSGFLVFFLSSILLSFHFSHSIYDNLGQINEDYHESVRELIHQKFEQRELLAVSTLMDEKTYRINTLLSDLEKVTELTAFTIQKFLINDSKSTRPIIKPKDFKENPVLKRTLVKDPKFNVPISYEYPDIILNTKSQKSRYSYLYWELRDIYRSFYKFYPHVLWTYVGFENDGSFINYPGTYSEPEDYDPRIRPWYLDAKNNNSTIWVKPYFDSGEGSLVISVSKSVVQPKTNNIYAVVGTDLVLKTFIEDIISFGNHYNMVFLIVDEGGQVIFNSSGGKNSGDWKQLPSNESLTQVFGIDNARMLDELPFGSFQKYIINSTQKYVYKRRLIGVNWTLVGLLEEKDLKQAYLANYNNLERVSISAKEAILASIKEYNSTYFFQLGLLISIGVLFYWMLQRNLVRPLNDMTLAIKNFHNTDDSEKNEYTDIMIRNDEIGQIISSFLKLKNEIKNYQIELKSQIELATLGKLASQLAHDIRSPLAALNMVVSQANVLPEETRLLVRSAVQRIHDIANDLSRHRMDPSPTPSTTATEQPAQASLISALIEALISEKRLQFRTNIDVEITATLDERSYGLFSNVQAGEFKRVLSNLINNSIEAMPENKGHVHVSLYSQRNRVVIEVADNGSGIPEDILPRLMQHGITHGKKNGTGLGLYHARTMIEKWGGHIDITSKVGEGTTVTLALPKQEPPAWFVSELKLTPKSHVIVIDDDNSIHQIWKGRFEPWVSNGAIQLTHFTDPQAFLNWHKANESVLRNTLYLCDYEFLGQSTTGLHIIRQAGINNQAILVTSHYEEEEIRSNCEVLGVRLIPKNLAGFVPISIVNDDAKNEDMTDQVCDAVLIDDDEIVHSVWNMRAKAHNKRLKTYSHPLAFWQESDHLSKTVPIYVDVDLGNGVKGSDVAQELSTKGFENIFLATGYDAKKFSDMPWLKGVIGKQPPW